MAISYVDAINIEPFTVTVGAEPWAQPESTSWLARNRKLNQLVKDATHLLRVKSEESGECTWYAGEEGTSLAAGIERMAISDERLRDCVVAFPLDERVYVAEVEQSLVRSDAMLFPDAFHDRIDAWRAEGRNFVLLTGGGRQVAEMPNALEVPVDIDEKAMTFQHASIAMLSAGLLRWRDLVAVLGCGLLVTCVTAGFTWWRSLPDVNPTERIAAIIAEPIPPARLNAAAELAPLAVIAATHDVALWRASGASRLIYNPEQRLISLTTSNPAPAQTHVGDIPSEIPNVAPYGIDTFGAKLAAHLEAPYWTVEFGAPYGLAVGDQMEQHVTVTIGADRGNAVISAAPALIELTERLAQLPVTFHRGDCNVASGVVTRCELKFAIRGESA